MYTYIYIHILLYGQTCWSLVLVVSKFYISMFVICISCYTLYYYQRFETIWAQLYRSTRDWLSSSYTSSICKSESRKHGSWADHLGLCSLPPKCAWCQIRCKSTPGGTDRWWGKQGCGRGGQERSGEEGFSRFNGHAAASKRPCLERDRSCWVYSSELGSF